MARAVLLGVVTVGGLALAGACSPYGGATVFNCDSDVQCGAGGACEADQLCSFVDAACPGGRAYGPSSGPHSNQCVGGSVDDAMRELDAPPAPDDVCYGAANGLVRPCFPSAPTGTRVVDSAIDTDPNSADCATTVTNTSACVIAGAAIQITGTVEVSGSRPLVFVATGAVEISGILDASSDRAATADPGQHYATSRIGPGANPAACAAGTPPTTSAGGAGGSFATLGGTGGTGLTGGVGGVPGAVQAATLRGGCDGQPGLTGTPGFAGHGGGAVYFIGASIAISGVINASGEGGDPGISGSAGGGGGGSGGLIGFDAATITSTGIVFANGGGGGEGSGEATRGSPGQDPAGIAAATGGSGATARGGDGGRGAAQSTPAGNGGAGISMMGSRGGGGGGGGGAGVIKVFGGGTLPGAVSPAPT
ncbi:MAG: hypothetical protein M3680_16350 [Myxococcota bacterium]|nr:hypothetical protein [Myxococcota bacterium]